MPFVGELQNTYRTWSSSMKVLQRNERILEYRDKKRRVEDARELAKRKKEAQQEMTPRAQGHIEADFNLSITTLQIVEKA